jgi:hypothetical protein
MIRGLVGNRNRCAVEPAPLPKLVDDGVDVRGAKIGAFDSLVRDIDEQRLRASHGRA